MTVTCLLCVALLFTATPVEGENAVTSNHGHLIARDDKGPDVIPQTIQWVAGRTGQEYNQRKGRKGAF
jgi:hypothetical protein